MGAGADAGATKGVLSDAGTAGDSERGGMADGRARVPEVLAPAELEGFLAGLVPEPLEPALGASVGEDVEEAQELAMDPTRGADDARQEGICDTHPRGVGLPVQCTLVRAAASRSLSGWAFLSAPFRLTSAM